MRLNVNRHLKDKAMDHIDHALGRPVDPMGETYRAYFAACASEADAFRASPHWREGQSASGLVWFYVTPAGRAALAAHLRGIGDKTRAFVVSWGGYETQVAAETRAAAKYRRWLEISDALPDLTFKAFQATARVRVA